MNLAVAKASASGEMNRATATAPSSKFAALPPLENGDRLPRREFERRYEAMPHIKKAELIEGVVYMGSPVRIKSHSRPHGVILGWLATYCAATPGTDFGDNGSLRLDLDNEPQPDAYLRLASGGRSHIDDDDYLAGAPELIVEIAASSASIDLGAKRNTYRRNGVQEYVVWRVLDQAIDWWELSDGEYVRLAAGAEGVLESRIFPGLRLDVSRLLADDLKGVLHELQIGLQTEPHRMFASKSAGLGEAIRP